MTELFRGKKTETGFETGLLEELLLTHVGQGKAGSRTMKYKSWVEPDSEVLNQEGKDLLEVLLDLCTLHTHCRTWTLMMTMSCRSSTV
jgi:hypothetical protein